MRLPAQIILIIAVIVVFVLRSKPESGGFRRKSVDLAAREMEMTRVAVGAPSNESDFRSLDNPLYGSGGGAIAEDAVTESSFSNRVVKSVQGMQKVESFC